MLILLWSLALIFIIIGVLGVILPALPGVPLAFVGFVIAAWIDKFQKVGVWTLGLLAILTVLSIVLDFLVSTVGAKKMGASFLGMTGAIVGTVVGIFFGIPGLLFGPFIGAVVGELFANKNLIHAGKVGVGTLIGLIVGVAIKLAILFAMLGLFAVSYFY